MRKNIFTTSFFILIFSIIFTDSSQAQQVVQSGSMEFRCSFPEYFQVEISGPQSLSQTFRGNLLITNLIPGNYEVTLFGINENSKSRGRNNLIFNNRIRLNSRSRTIISLSSGSRPFVESVPDHNNIALCISGSPNPWDDYGRSPVEPTLNQRDFDRLIKTLRDASFDKNRMEILSVTSGKCLYYTDQIRQILTLFSFDGERLNAAKMLAVSVVDSYNLYLLEKSFDFPSNARKFYDFLKELETQNRNNNRR